MKARFLSLSILIRYKYVLYHNHNSFSTDPALVILLFTPVQQANETDEVTKPPLTGIPQIDYVWDPNLPRELNG